MKILLEYAAATGFVYIETKSLVTCWKKNGQPFFEKAFLEKPVFIKRISMAVVGAYAVVTYMGIGIAGGLPLAGLLSWAAYVAVCLAWVEAEVELPSGVFKKYSFGRELALVSFEICLLYYFGFCKLIFRF